MKNRMLTAMTALCMMAAPVCGTLSEVMQSAVTANAAESGKCGENLTWTLDADGTLTISGTGEMDSKPFSSDFRKTIKEIVIKPGVTNISNRAFDGCENLTSVTIPSSVTSIGIAAFNLCKKLTSVIISEGVVIIDGFAFDTCTSLTTVTIPESVTSIRIGAFCRCTKLTTVTILNPECEINDDEATFCNNLVVENTQFIGTICGYPGSTAQAYAQKYGRTFKALDGVPSTPVPQSKAYSTGDVTGDAVINAKDANAVLIAAAKVGTGNLSGLSYEAGEAADVNSDGMINAKDANSILRYAAAVGTGVEAKIADYI